MSVSAALTAPKARKKIHDGLPPTHARGPEWAARLADAKPGTVRRMFTHPTRVTRQLHTLVDRIECAKCDQLTARVVSIALATRHGYGDRFAVVEAFCPTCGYFTASYGERDRVVDESARSGR